MATRIAWLLNLDADAELRDPDGYRAARAPAERLRELRAQIADLVAPDDLVLEAERIAPGTAGELLAVQAFCPTPSALAQIAALGLTPPPAPPLAVLRAVNDRAFCAALGHGLPGASFVRDMAALEAQLAQPSPSGWHVIKRAFSFAGREQRRVQGGALDASTRGFCARSFARGEGVQVEPWVARVQDFARHGYLLPGGALLMGPTRAQRCDAMGRFQAMAAEPAGLRPEHDALLAQEVARTGAALAAAGYFGPFGIDAFSYRQAPDRIALDPRCEINARFTMGYPRALLLAAIAPRDHA